MADSREETENVGDLSTTVNLLELNKCRHMAIEEQANLLLLLLLLLTFLFLDIGRVCLSRSVSPIIKSLLSPAGAPGSLASRDWDTLESKAPKCSGFVFGGVVTVLGRASSALSFRQFEYLTSFNR